MHHRLERFRGAAPQAVNGHHVAAAHVREQRADGRLGRRNRDIDLPGLQQVDVGPAVDERYHAPRAHALGEERAHDVVLVVVGHGDEEVHLADVFALEQLLVGGVAVQHQRFAQARRDQLAAALVVLDHPDRIAVLEREGKPQADVAAPGNHHPPYRAVHAPELAHDLADVVGGREAEHFVAGLDHRVAVRHDGAVAAKDRHDARVDARDVAAQLLQRMADQGPAGERPHRNQAHLAAGEVEHLERLRELDQLDDIVGQDLLRADREVHVKSVLAQNALVREVVGGAYARDAARHVEHAGGDAAGDQIRLVGLGNRDQQVGIVDAGLDENRGMGAAADDRAQVEPLLQRTQALRLDIDYRDVVRFRNEALSDRAADLPGPEDYDLHSSRRPTGSPSALSLR